MPSLLDVLASLLIASALRLTEIINPPNDAIPSALKTAATLATDLAALADHFLTVIALFFSWLRSFAPSADILTTK